MYEKTNSLPIYLCYHLRLQRYAESLNLTNLFNQMGLFFSQSPDLYFLKKPEKQKVYRIVWMFTEKTLSLPPQKPLKTILLILS